MAVHIYKPGQGYYTRLLTSLGLGAVVALGCWRLYQELGGLSLPEGQLILVRTLVPVGLFVVLAGLVLWLVNKPSLADFMIAAEGEIKKVSWSSRREVAASTGIVIVVVICMAALLAVTDLVFQFFFRFINLLPG